VPVHKKANKSESEARTAKVATLLLNGARRSDIIEYANTETTWDISNAQIDIYIRKATDIITLDIEGSVETQRNIAMTRLNMLYGACIASGRLKDALNVQQEINKLFGLYATDGSATGLPAIQQQRFQLEFVDVATEELDG
jgi:hypothetical protein